MPATEASLFGWRRNNRAASDASTPSTRGAAQRGNTAQVKSLSEPVARLYAYLNRAGVPALLRPLGPPLVLVGEAVRGQPANAPVLQALSAAADFLTAREAPEQHLEFALAVHTCQAATRCFLGGVESALADLCRKHGEGSGGRTHAALEAWRGGVQAFEDGCREAWELHAYFVFLDVKGDRALLEHVADRLCLLLDCPPDAVGACLARTRPWAEDALRELSKKGLLELLERQHAAALVQRHAAWMKRFEHLGEEAQKGQRFWESFFDNLLKCSWPDFAEAFEEFYIGGPLPVDMLAQLRFRMDPKSTQQASRAGWKALTESYGSVWDLFGGLAAEVLADVRSCIYRAEPLPRAERPRPPRNVTKLTSGPAVAPSSAAGSPTAPGAASKAPSGGPRAGNSKPGPKPTDVTQDSEVDTAASATPVDPRLLAARVGGGRYMPWDEYVASLALKDRPWWLVPGEQWHEDEAGSDKEPLRVTALRMVNSTVAYTHRAMVLRIVSGDQANTAPLLGRPNAAEEEEGGSCSSSLPGSLQPALAIVANGARFGGVTRFGRDSYRQLLTPDIAMGEPIASRSHFNVAFDQRSDSYKIMDAGSKWGTFTKISPGAGVTLSCGDWIRVGNAEFLVRYCGGGCNCARQHAHYRLHSIHVLREQMGPARMPAPLPWGQPQMVNQGSSPKLAGDSQKSREEEEDARGESSEEEGLRGNVMQLLSGVRQRGWVSQAVRLCERGAEVGSPTRRAARASHSSTPEVREKQAQAHKEAALAPASPLELDFISGPSAGQRVALCERLCTMGRGEGNTVQVSDPNLSNISRLHCIFEWEGNRWRLRDNSSTNGTWRRLSCVLDPSRLMPLEVGTSVLAGVHEFLVEEANLWHCYIPSTAVAMLEARAAKGAKVAA